MSETPKERESRMRDLAQQLLFKVEESDGRFILIRTADVSGPVTEKDLTLKEATMTALPSSYHSCPEYNARSLVPTPHQSGFFHEF